MWCAIVAPALHSGCSVDLAGAYCLHNPVCACLAVSSKATIMNNLIYNTNVSMTFVTTFKRWKIIICTPMISIIYKLQYVPVYTKLF